MADVIDGTVPAGALRDKIVLVGATAMAIGDLRNTPFQSGTASYMGVEVHANIIDNLLHSDEPGRTFLTRGIREDLIDAGFIVLFGLAFGAWFARIKPLYSTLSLVCALAAVRMVRLFQLRLHGKVAQLCDPGRNAGGELRRDYEFPHDLRRT